MPRGRQIKRQLPATTLTIAEAANAFYENNEVKGLAEATQKAYQIYVGCFGRWLGENTDISAITPATIDKYILQKREDGNKPASIQTTIRHLKRFFSFCAKRGFMAPIEIENIKVEQELKEPYTDEEMRVLLKNPKTENFVEFRSWVMVNYFFGTGQRLSTVLNIKVEDLDLNNNTVKLVWNKDKIQKRMPLSKQLVKILEDYIYIWDLEEQDYLFPAYEGGRLATRSCEDAIRDYNRARGVSKSSIHLFRHTFAKNYILNGGNPAKLQKLMNHKDIQTTMKYVNLYNEDFSQDFDSLNPLDSLMRGSYQQKKRIKLAN